MNQLLQSGNDLVAEKDNRDMVESELSGAQLDRLVHYFGINSADTSESLVEGINTLVRLMRS